MNDELVTEAEKIRSCLIGGFLDCQSIPALPASSSGCPRFNPFVSPDGSISSLDMVRLDLRFDGDAAAVAEMEGQIQKSPCDSYSQFDSKRSKPGAYAHLYSLGYGETSAAVGVHQFTGPAVADHTKGFLEFNPNKLGTNPDFLTLLGVIAPYVDSCTVARYDMAVDIPVYRATVRIRKDRRRYEFVQGAVLTEYLGARNKPGRVKVYDKAAELGEKGGKLTRVELTCSGDWAAAEIIAHWPTVYRAKVSDDEKPGIKTALALACAELIESGVSAEKVLSGVDHHLRKKLRSMFEGETYPCPELGAAHVYFQAEYWAKYVSSQA